MEITSSFIIYVLIILSVIILALSVSLAIYYTKYREALKNSIVDELTGIFNSCYLHQRLREEISRAIRFKHSLYLLFIDLDNFKQVNDIFGHDEGNEVLKKAAETLLKIMRPHDVLVRNGGDEFVVLTAEMSWKNINSITERLRLELKNISTSNCDNPITASIGLHRVDLTKPGDDAIKAADAAMYEAKSQGGNMVCISLESQVP